MAAPVVKKWIDLKHKEIIISATVLFRQLTDKKLKQLQVKIEYYANFIEESSLKILVIAECFIEGICSTITRFCQNNYRKLRRVESSASNLREKNESTRQKSTPAYIVHYLEHVLSISDIELDSDRSVAGRRPEKSRFNYREEAMLTGRRFSFVDATDVSTIDDYFLPLLEEYPLNPNNSANGFNALFAMESSYNADILEQLEAVFQQIDKRSSDIANIRKQLEEIKSDISQDTLNASNTPALFAIRSNDVPSLYFHEGVVQQIGKLNSDIEDILIQLEESKSDISQDTSDVLNIYRPVLFAIRSNDEPSLYFDEAIVQQLQDRLNSAIFDDDIKDQLFALFHRQKVILIEGKSTTGQQEASDRKSVVIYATDASVCSLLPENYFCETKENWTFSIHQGSQNISLTSEYTPDSQTIRPRIKHNKFATNFRKVNKEYLSDTVAGCTDDSRKSAPVGPTPCSEIPKNNVFELNVGSSENVSDITYGKQLETGRNEITLNRQVDDELTYLNRHAVGPDEFQLIKPVFALSLYERKQVSLEELKRLDSESRVIFLLRETEVHTKEAKSLGRGPQYKLAVVTAEGFEDAWRQSLEQENSLECSNYFPRDSKMIVCIPVYRLGFINRSDRKRQKDSRHGS